MSPRVDLIQLRAGSAGAWTAASAEILAAGEIGAEKDTGRIKSGDGVRTWATLPYVDDLTRSLYVPNTARGTANGVATLGANSKISPAHLLNGVANGQATLDGNGKVPSSQIASGGGNTLATLDAGAKLTSTQIPTTVVLTASKGAVNGVAGLDATGKVPAAQLPPRQFSIVSMNAQVTFLTNDTVIGTVGSITGNAVSRFQITTSPIALRATPGPTCTDGDRILVCLYRVGNATALAQWDYTSVHDNPLSGNSFCKTVPSFVAYDVPPAGAASYQLRTYRNSGYSSAFLLDLSTYPAHLAVEQVT